MSDQHNRRLFLARGLTAAPGLLISAYSSAGCHTSPRQGDRLDWSAKPLKDRLFVMDTWFYKCGWNIERQSAFLRSMRSPYNSYCRGDWNALPDIVSRMDRERIDLVTTYAVFDIDAGAPPDYFPKLMEVLDGRNTLIWLGLLSQKWRPSDPAGDESAESILRELSRMARLHGLTLSIYPHFGFWAERIDHISRLLQRTDRPNLGCTFNLYHWLKAEGPGDLQAKARTALPYLNCLSINGSWNHAMQLKVEEAILPLGEGDTDVERFVWTFERLGYRGPIGLQGYGIQGNIAAKLKQSFRVWNSYCRMIEASL